MYNENLKRRFISERTDEVIIPINYLKNYFEKVSDIETRLQKDVSNFTYYEIIEFYKILNKTSISTLRVLNSQLSIYTQWCLQQNLVSDSQNHYLEIKTEDYMKCINKVLLEVRVIDKETIYDWIKELVNPRDQFILLGLFEGIKGKDFCELAKLRPEDVNGNKLILCTGREVKISDKLKYIIQQCIEERIYYPLKGIRKYIFRDNGYVIKDYSNVLEDHSDKRRGRTIYNIIRRLFIYFDIQGSVNANCIFESGKIHMIKTRAKELNMTCEEYINSPYIKEVTTQFNFYLGSKREFINKYADYWD